MQTALTQLSTGKRINSGADDPAGLIASQALAGEITNTQQAVSNSQMASNMISTADSSLGQIGTLLTTIQGLVSQAASTGNMRRQCHRRQPEGDRLVAGRHQPHRQHNLVPRPNLLDGTLAFTTTPGTLTAGTAFATK